jgi:hypothetical protein
VSVKGTTRSHVFPLSRRPMSERCRGPLHFEEGWQKQLTPLSAPSNQIRMFPKPVRKEEFRGSDGMRMTPRLQYGTTAKVFYWTIVALLLVQYLIGWLMPDIHRGWLFASFRGWSISFFYLLLFPVLSPENPEAGKLSTVFIRLPNGRS